MLPPSTITWCRRSRGAAPRSPRNGDGDVWWRRIFLMSRLRQQTYREIAQQFCITDKAVEHHIYRALARCRKAFAARYA
ncbi:MAG: sigma factor-like helix-turn-helix DNA-binding protein [Xanthobacteraceae bacterium]